MPSMEQNTVDHLSRGQRPQDAAASPLRVLVVAPTFPSNVDPGFGIFVKERIKALSKRPGVDIRVLAPVPWFPPIKVSATWYRWSQFPRIENVDGLTVYRPRYLLPPKMGGYFHSELMFRAAFQQAKRIRRDFDFDLIDSHFVYPGGVVAVRLALKLGVPVTTTGRGEDMNRFPNLPVKGDRIRWALPRCDHCFGVSREIADAMVRNGAQPENVSVLANGIDPEKFYPVPKGESRAALNLEHNTKYILSVGEKIPRKGFELLIQAMPQVLRHHPETILVLLGRRGRHGRDVTQQLESLIKHHGLVDHVRLEASCSHDQLRQWYGASDLFALMSSSEGCPNVLLEALACGTPCIATPVGSVAYDLRDSSLGIVLRERSISAAERAITEGLGRRWDREYIAAQMLGRTWDHVAQEFEMRLRSIHASLHGQPSTHARHRPAEAK